MTAAAARSRLESSLFDPALLPAALEQAGSVLGHDYFGLIHADFSQPRIIASERQREAIASYFTGGWQEVDYRIRAEAETATGALFLDHVHVEDGLRRSSTIYNEFFAPLDMANYAGIRFDIDGQQWYCAAARSEARGVIAAAEANTFARVARTAIRTAAMIARLERTRTSGMLQGLEVTGTPAILLDGSGCVVDLTTAAAALFDEDFNLREGRLRAAAPPDAAALDQLRGLARAEPPLPSAVAVLRGRAQGRMIQVDATRITGNGLDDLVGARLLLILTDLGAANRGLTDDLRRLYNLTPAEADVAGQFGEGRSVQQIAARRLVAESTVREQMKSIYRKTGVQRQVDLMRILTGLQD